LSSQARFWTIFLLPFFGLAAFVAGYFFGVSFTSDFLGDCRLPPLFVTAVNFKPFDNSLLRLYSSFLAIVAPDDSWCSFWQPSPPSTSRFFRPLSFTPQLLPLLQYFHCSVSRDTNTI
jgi:hypothetical protein